MQEHKTDKKTGGGEEKEKEEDGRMMSVTLKGVGEGRRSLQGDLEVGRYVGLFASYIHTYIHTHLLYVYVYINDDDDDDGLVGMFRRWRHHPIGSSSQSFTILASSSEAG